MCIILALYTTRLVFFYTLAAARTCLALVRGSCSPTIFGAPAVSLHCSGTPIETLHLFLERRDALGAHETRRALLAPFPEEVVRAGLPRVETIDKFIDRLGFHNLLNVVEILAVRANARLERRYFARVPRLEPARRLERVPREQKATRRHRARKRVDRRPWVTARVFASWRALAVGTTIVKALGSAEQRVGGGRRP